MFELFEYLKLCLKTNILANIYIAPHDVDCISLTIPTKDRHNTTKSSTQNPELSTNSQHRKSQQVLKC